MEIENNDGTTKTQTGHIGPAGTTRDGRWRQLENQRESYLTREEVSLSLKSQHLFYLLVN